MLVIRFYFETQKNVGGYLSYQDIQLNNMKGKDISIVEEQFDFQKKEWVVHRISWVLMGIFLIVGLTGLWGTGPLSKGKIENEVFGLEYEHFTRVKEDFELRVALKSYDHSPEISINADYFQKVKLKEIFPRPESMKVEKDKYTFGFNEINRGVIIFYLEPLKMGNQDLEIIMNNRKEKAHQVIYF